MKNKILIGAIIALAGILIFENAYLLGRYSRGRVHKPDYARYQSAPAERLPARPLSVVHEMPSWDPFEEMNKMQEGIVNFREDEPAYTVEAYIPGVTKDDIKIQVKDRKLIISAEVRKDDSAKGKDFYSKESSYGAFLNQFILPEDAEISRMTSDYKDDVLKITIPKKKLRRHR